MSHEIETSESGEAAFVTADGKPAWHGLGTVTSDALTAEDAARLAHLDDWNVHLTDVYATTGKSGMAARTLKVPGTKATVRTNPFDGELEALATVGSRYRPIQNEDAFQVLNAITDEAGATFETAGSLFKGRQVFMTQRLSEDILIGGEDAHNLYIAALNSHDGSGAFRIIVTPVRIVCANTQTMAIGRAKRTFSIRHTESAEGRVQEARDALALTYKYAEAFQAECEKLLSQKMTEDEFYNIIAMNLVPDPTSELEGWMERARTSRAALTDLFTTAPENEFGRGTKYAAYNAVTQWTDHKRNSRPDIRGREALLGDDVFKNAALALL